MQCIQCGSQFEYFPGEKEAYTKFDAPLSANCHECRQRRRMAFRNERKLYYNKSALSGKKIIALYPGKSLFKIIDQDEWWNDANDSTIYGQDFNFNRPFFEQFKELQLKVPRWSRIGLNCENSEFTNNCADMKNSYLSFSSHNSEDLLYCMRVYRSICCIDCINVSESQYCSQCADCKKSYNLHFSQFTENCSDSYFLFNCRGCRNCILCANLRNKKYTILNKQYSKEEYEIQKKNFVKELFSNKEGLIKKFEELKRQIPHENAYLINCENVIGDFTNDSKNVYNGFHATGAKDCINVYNCDQIKNCYDNYCNDKSELCLECDTNFEMYNTKFCTYTGSIKDGQYCDQCFYLENCFGCIGLKRQKYMILNKKYSKENYEKMLKRILEYLKKTGEYGRPFPLYISPFAYNNTIASEYYPLTKEEVEKQGMIWQEEIEEAAKEVPEKATKCEISGKEFKIIPQELRFYEKFKLPLPKRSPYQRYIDLRGLQNRARLNNAICAACNKKIQTTYDKEAIAKLKILCEDCYLKIAY